MRYYPVFLDLSGKNCLVVGGGRVAERKIRTLLDCGAHVRVVSRELTEWIDDQVKNGRVEFAGEQFHPGQMEGVRLVIAATSNSELNREVARKADSRSIWCNVADQPEDCTFILPSIVVRGDLTIAISTSGKSPALARKIREELEKKFGEEYAKFTEILGLIRKQVLEKYDGEEDRKKIFTSLVESNIVELIKNSQWKHVESVLSRILGENFSLEGLKYRRDQSSSGNGTP